MALRKSLSQVHHSYSPKIGPHIIHRDISEELPPRRGQGDKPEVFTEALLRWVDVSKRGRSWTLTGCQSTVF